MTLSRSSSSCAPPSQPSIRCFSYTPDAINPYPLFQHRSKAHTSRPIMNPKKRGKITFNPKPHVKFGKKANEVLSLSTVSEARTQPYKTPQGRKKSPMPQLHPESCLLKSPIPSNQIKVKAKEASTGSDSVCLLSFSPTTSYKQAP